MLKVIALLALLGCSTVAGDWTFSLGQTIPKDKGYCLGLAGAGCFIFQKDGNAVIYLQFNIPLWNTGTAGKGHRFIFQTDGNLVLYDVNNVALWQSQTYGKGANRLVYQDDRNLVIYTKDNKALWSSGTQIIG